MVTVEDPVAAAPASRRAVPTSSLRSLEPSPDGIHDDALDVEAGGLGDVSRPGGVGGGEDGPLDRVPPDLRDAAGPEVASAQHAGLFISQRVAERVLSSRRSHGPGERSDVAHRGAPEFVPEDS
jgi:hypothetical protein